MSDKSETNIDPTSGLLIDTNKINNYFEKLYDYYFKYKKENKGFEIGEKDVDVLVNNHLWNLFVVYSDLRNRGYIVKVGLLQNSLYIYKKSKNEIKDIIFVLEENQNITYKDLSQYIYISKRYDAESLIAIVDKYGDITYYNLKEVNLVNYKK